MIVCKSPSELRKMYAANRIVATVLSELEATIAPGVTTQELDEFAEARVVAAGATPAFKGYNGYPATLCTSINDAVVHGIPTRQPLSEGDVISIDMGVLLDGYYGDSALTVGVGRIGPEAARLLRVTEEALKLAIAAVQVNARVSDLGHAVQTHVESHGFSVVREYVGHGIGTELHEDPQIPNYGRPGRGPRLREGMVLAIEPMVNVGGPAIRLLDDGWTAVTRDGGLSAHFEHSVAVTVNGPQILSDRHDPSAAW